MASNSPWRCELRRESRTVIRHDDPAAVLFDRSRNRVQILHRDRALEAVRPTAAARLLPLVQQALHTGFPFVAGVHQVEVGRSPRLEAPLENGLVETPTALHVIGMKPQIEFYEVFAVTDNARGKVEFFEETVLAK